MLTVHHLGVSQSERIVWLCEELAMPYRLIRYERDPLTRMAPPEYKALHPFGTAPVVTDGDLTLAESGAIMEYLIAKHGGGRLAVNPGAPDYADYLFWFHFANGSMMPSAMIDIIVQMVGASQPDNVKLLRERSDKAYAMLEERLEREPYLAGAGFSAADIMMFFPLTTLRRFIPRDLSACPNVRAYLARVGARETYTRAMTKADPGLTPLLT